MLSAQHPGVALQPKPQLSEQHPVSSRNPGKSSMMDPVERPCLALGAAAALQLSFLYARVGTLYYQRKLTVPKGQI